ncbi:MAG: hypothetical protein D6701_04675 [Gemmatimonadetes bacterium]|nr:MAG: hypothetical protein D6701_04675 [Gemmatimonadota bacterium]
MADRTFEILRRAVGAAVCAVLVAGCSSSTDSGGPRPVDGLVVRDPFGPVVTVQGSDVLGELEVLLDFQTPLLTVTFANDLGEAVQTSGGDQMTVTIADESLATWSQAGPFTGMLNGLSPGETTARFSLIQGGQTVYTSPAIGLTVLGQLRTPEPPSQH